MRVSCNCLIAGLLALCVPACQESSDQNDEMDGGSSSADLDTDSDSDADSDTDSDTDMDTDGDSDTGSDGDSDGDTDSESDTGSETEVDTETDTIPKSTCWLVDTGQKSCADGYDWVTCSSIYEGDDMFGQDGHYEPADRQRSYKDNGDGTVSEAVSGLMWEQTHADSPMTWNAALLYCKNQTTGGHTDWRLPSVIELTMLAHRGRYDPAIDYIYLFPDTPSAIHWTSTGYSTGAKGVHFRSGRAIWWDKLSDEEVRCVRGNIPTIGDFDVDVGSDDRVVSDNGTGLMWQGCPAGQSGDTCEVGDQMKFEWRDALSYCETLDWGGYEDWRLPDIIELQSIVHPSPQQIDPSIDETAFPSNGSNRFWSSTPFEEQDGNIWFVSFKNGDMFTPLDVLFDDENSVRCVRTEPIC